MQKTRLFAASLSLLLMCTAAGCRSINNDDAVNSIKNAGTDGAVAREEATIANVTAGESTVRVVAAGDNMLQSGVLSTAQSDDGSYDFSSCYADVKDIIAQGDLKIVNQKSIISDDENIGISGESYCLSSPPEAGESLVNAGFNVISMASSHLFDMGSDGLESCLDYWDAAAKKYSGLVTYGAYRNEEDMNNIRTCEINGMTVAFLAYTDSMNGNEYSYYDSELQVVYTTDEDKIKSQIEAAAGMADAVIVSVNWGMEDQFEPVDSQKSLAQNMVDWGADVILGNSTHVPQTMEYLTRQDGSQGFVFYSLGNLISAQTYNINLVGELAAFDIKKDHSGNVSIENIEVTPVISHFEDAFYGNIRAIPYGKYTQGLCEEHGLPYLATNPMYSDWDVDTIKSIIDQGIPAEYQKLD